MFSLNLAPLRGLIRIFVCASKLSHLFRVRVSHWLRSKTISPFQGLLWFFCSFILSITLTPLRGLLWFFFHSFYNSNTPSGLLNVLLMFCTPSGFDSSLQVRLIIIRSLRGSCLALIAFYNSDTPSGLLDDGRMFSINLAPLRRFHNQCDWNLRCPFLLYKLHHNRFEKSKRCN